MVAAIALNVLSYRQAKKVKTIISDMQMNRFGPSLLEYELQCEQMYRHRRLGLVCASVTFFCSQLARISLGGQQDLDQFTRMKNCSFGHVRPVNAQITQSGQSSLSS